MKRLFKFIRHYFKKKPKFLKFDEQRASEAFSFQGVTYFQFDDAFKMPAGRGLQALTIYEEFGMRVTAEYLDLHIRAMEKILSDPSRINIQAIAIINHNLKERRNLAMFPDHVYKLASVMFFDETESPYNYDPFYNQKKIEKWRQAEGTLDFFLKGPLNNLIPYMDMPADRVQMFFQTAEQIDQLHRSDLRDILSSKA